MKRVTKEPAISEAAVSHCNDSLPSTVTSMILPDDGEASSMFCTAWLELIKASRTLIDTGSIVDIVSEHMLNQLPKQMVHSDGHLNINLADNNKCTLHNYT